MTSMPDKTRTSAMLSAMAHRPYPKRDRARRQLERHRFELPPTPLPTAAEVGERLTRSRRAIPSVDEYRLSRH
ncbi:hypothetical protein [Streptomyces sp. NPDC056683]|uniref:hypothetical protein n=1 Tax=Streptomyces sp. NPDC056683 TaxID=3345910 RepID=UPI0036AB5D6B